MNINDNLNNYITMASAITIIGGTFILIMLISRYYLIAIFEHVDGLLMSNKYNEKYKKLYNITKGNSFGLIKRIIDLCFGLCYLLLVWPIFLIIATLIKITSQGPILFRQKRIGKGGKIFHAYKFRTMRAFSQEDMLLNEVNFSDDDNRITSVGRFLRRTNLDELPKILNILKGDMSIVGTSAAIDSLYINELDKEAFDMILSTKPGIVSLWSLSGSRMRWNLSSRSAYDLYYVYHESFVLDLSIFLMTPLSVLGRAGYGGVIIKKIKNRKKKTGS